MSLCKIQRKTQSQLKNVSSQTPKLLQAHYIDSSIFRKSYKLPGKRDLSKFHQEHSHFIKAKQKRVHNNKKRKRQPRIQNFFIKFQFLSNCK